MGLNEFTLSAVNGALYLDGNFVQRLDPRVAKGVEALQLKIERLKEQAAVDKSYIEQYRLEVGKLKTELKTANQTALDRKTYIDGVFSRMQDW